MRTRRTHNSSTKLCWLGRGRDYPFKASIYGSRRTQPRGRIGAQRGGRIASDTIFHECSKTKTSSQKFCSMAGWMLTCHAGVRSRPRRAHRRKEACQVLAPDRRGRHQQHPIYNALPETDELQEVGGVGFAAPQRQRSGAMGGGKATRFTALVVRGKPPQISEMLKSGPSLLTQDRIGPVLVLVGVRRRKRRWRH